MLYHVAVRLCLISIPCDFHVYEIIFGVCFLINIYVICVLFAYSDVQHILFCVVFLRLMYLMLPDSLDCPFVIALSVFSGLSICDCPLGILWIVHF